jgi:hypothetical protein
MLFTFVQDYNDFKAGDRVPASCNIARLLRAGIVKRHSYTEAFLATQEAVEAPVEAPAVDETTNEPKRRGRPPKA